jgi:hypothetical protein
VASTDTAGAAAGGSVTVTAGAAARNASGNANGGDIVLATGAGIGTGTAGSVIVPLGTAAAPGIEFTGDAGTGIFQRADNFIMVASNGTEQAYFRTPASDSGALSLNGGLSLHAGSPAGIGATAGVILSASGVIRVTNGATGLGSTLTSRLVEANTAGVGSPNVLVANESRSLFTNEGVTAMNHHTLPAAAAGLEYMFYVQDADGITITAAAGDTIRVAGSASSAGGTAANSTIGGFIQLIAINATEWVAGATQGTWTLT